MKQHLRNTTIGPDHLSVAGWWHTAGDRVVCDLCPRYCTLPEGARGFCFVRQNVGGQLALTTYGRSTGFCIDPIEKKPLNHFYPGSSVLSFGTAGCNLGCKFCQNWSISKSREVDVLSKHAGPEAIAEAAARLGCKSVAFTYNDPIIWAEYAIDAAHACHERGIKTVAVTSGFINPEPRKPFFDVMDAANVDLKGFTEHFYKHLTLSHLAPVLETLVYLKRETSVWLEITNLVIPQENDSDDEIREMCAWIHEHLGDDVPVHFTGFHPDYRLRNRPPTPPQTLIRAREIALEAGLEYAYTGNVFDVARQSTWCPKCRELLIERAGYDITQYHLHGSRCEFCQHPIPGCFEDRPPGKQQRSVLCNVSDLVYDLDATRRESAD
jgi:pyruvate formate lyase activating enzyme